MLKRFLALAAALSIALGARTARADCTVSGGFGSCTLFLSQTSPGVSTIVNNFSLIGHFIPWTTTGSPTTVNLEVDGSSDGGVTWQKLASTTGTATFGWFEVGDLWGKLRLNVTSFVGGTNPTITAYYFGTSYVRFATTSASGGGGGGSATNVQGTQADGAGTEPNPVLVSGWSASGTVMNSMNVTAGGSAASNSSNVLLEGGSDTINARVLTVIPQAGTTNATPNELIVGGMASLAGAPNGYALTVAPDNTATSLANSTGVAIAGSDGAHLRVVTAAANNTAVTTAIGQMNAGWDDSGKSYTFNVSQNANSTYNNSNAAATELIVGGTNAPTTSGTGNTYPLPIQLGAQSTSVNQAITFIPGGGTDGTSGRSFEIVPNGNAFTGGAPQGLLIAGSDFSNGSSSDGRVIGVGVNGVAISGTAPNTLIMGGIDATATNAVVRTMYLGGSSGTVTGTIYGPFSAGIDPLLNSHILPIDTTGDSQSLGVSTIPARFLSTAPSLSTGQITYLLTDQNARTYITPPNEISVENAPTVGNLASVTIAGVAGKKHVLRSLCATLVDVSAITTPLDVQITDNVTVVWDSKLEGAAGTNQTLCMSALAITSAAAATSMTVAFAGTIGGSNFSTISVSYFDQ